MAEDEWHGGARKTSPRAQSARGFVRAGGLIEPQMRTRRGAARLRPGAAARALARDRRAGVRRDLRAAASSRAPAGRRAAC